VTTLDDAIMAFLDSPWNVIGAALVAFAGVLAYLYLGKMFFYVRFIVKSLFRNVLRTALTGMATFMLVLVITLVWMVLSVLDQVTTEKSKDLKAIVTEQWQIPSQMPVAYEAELAAGGVSRPEEIKVQDSMNWCFYGGTLDLANRTRENIVFFFAMTPTKMMSTIGLSPADYQVWLALQDERRRMLNATVLGSDSEKAERSRQLSAWDVHPNKGGVLARMKVARESTEKERDALSEPILKKLLASEPRSPVEESNLETFLTRRCSYVSMMDGLDEMTDREKMELYLACLAMTRDRRKVVLGRDRLAALQKKVGEKMKVYGLNLQGIDLEVEILGTFPRGRYDGNAILNQQYVYEALDSYKRSNGGVAHPMAGKTLNLMWLRMADTSTFREVAEDIASSPRFTAPAVKCETASSGIASFLDAYRNILFGIRYIFVPAMLATMSLVIANAISISVRERRGEMAVLKVLGFSPAQLMVFVLGEALLIGCGFGLASAAGTFALINWYFDGLKFPIGFFPSFRVPLAAFWWGPAIGGMTALAGSLLPSWSARSVKVSEVFSKIS
jgi:putative ABC transport system permease protein